MKENLLLGKLGKYRGIEDMPCGVCHNEVLLLLPDTTNKLLVAWKGPIAILERSNRVNYVIDYDGVPKQFHDNLIKKYHRRADVNFVHISDSTGTDYFPVRADPLFNCQACIVDDNPFSEIITDSEEVSVLPPTVSNISEADKAFSLCSDLSNQQIKLLSAVLNKFKHVMTPLPGCSDTIEHDIELQTSEPVRAKFYQVPVNLSEYFTREVNILLELKTQCSSPVAWLENLTVVIE